jgi:hypothetical protein
MPTQAAVRRRGAQSLRAREASERDYSCSSRRFRQITSPCGSLARGPAVRRSSWLKQALLDEYRSFTHAYFLKRLQIIEHDSMPMLTVPVFPALCG